MQGSFAAAFTLVEVMIAVGILGIMMVSLYGAFAFGFSEIQNARETVRATQILQQKMEMVRLLNWDQVINLPGYVPSTFTASYYSNTPTNAPTDDLIYSGTVSITTPPTTETYADKIRQIEVQVTWTSCNVTHKKTMTTFVTEHGTQNYIY